jgi:acylphosphatase
MKIREAFTYPRTDVESVYALVTNAQFREEAVAAVRGEDIEVTVEPSEDGHTIIVLQTQPANVPDFIKKFTGDSVRVKQTERWGAADDEGNRAAEVKFTVIGQPVDMLGNAQLSANGDVSFVVEGDLKVRAPFIGRKIEPEIARIIAASLRNDVERGIARLS